MSDIDEKPIDLSALEPTRWDAILAATAARAERVLDARAQSPTELIASWSRPLLVAAAILVALLVPIELLFDARERRTEQVERLVSLSVMWAQGTAEPSAMDLKRALGRETLR